jgi:ribosome modulation factor
VWSLWRVFSPNGPWPGWVETTKRPDRLGREAPWGMRSDGELGINNGDMLGVSNRSPIQRCHSREHFLGGFKTGRNDDALRCGGNCKRPNPGHFAVRQTQVGVG